MGNNNSELPKEEEDDIDFNETAITTPIPPDPNTGSFDSNITENVEGAVAISISNVKSVSLNFTNIFSNFFIFNRYGSNVL